MAVIMDGKGLASKIRSSLAEKVNKLSRKGIRPGLAVVLAGNDPASAIYVKNKKADCAECGIESFEYLLPDGTPQGELTSLIAELNANGKIHGILVQLPLPRGLNEAEVIASIDPCKDVDAFHAENVGLICQGTPRFLPCTPAGVMALLDEYKIDPAGKHCVVVGRSNIVGKPQALLLLHRHGTVSICHSRTPGLGSITRQADILVAAAGKAGLITGEMIKPGAIAIDVAMNRNEQGTLCGDMVFDEIEPIAAYITPVPGGVGPMTRAMLMQNTLTAAESTMNGRPVRLCGTSPDVVQGSTRRRY
ncbi:MAG: bifunctional methylenetetrahydrofolate dehydrogenase/methenyltetrahydrofolate cyclohydrolase FolD [Oscillospiraceae bacterium]|nr:bifunctional methylenetetrahydrofolate dehydrogenase/methenyltetrahydrofolate cyclohydrolase FolD [Oscillospiraceae bacterium]